MEISDLVRNAGVTRSRSSLGMPPGRSTAPTFPLRGHSYAKESGLAFVATGKLGRFWEFVLYVFPRFDQFSVARQLQWAEAVGIDRKVFEQTMANPASRESLVEITKEGIVNGVNATPTFFINRRRYRGELIIPEELIDVLEEEFDRTNGIQYLQWKEAAPTGVAQLS